MSKPKLSYFDFDGGRGEAARLALAIGGIAFDDDRVPFVEWESRKAYTPFGALPVLEIDGRTVAQSNGINRYVGKLADLYPGDPWQSAQGGRYFVDESSDSGRSQSLRLDPPSQVWRPRSCSTGPAGSRRAETGRALRADQEPSRRECILRPARNQGLNTEGAMYVSGQCLCGAVRYSGNTDPHFQVKCYCTDCRRTSAAGHAAMMGFAADAIGITGEVREFHSRADSGTEVARAFCPTCGAGVYSRNAAMPHLIFVRASTLDDPALFAPQLVVYASRAPAWDPVSPSEGVPAFPEGPPRN